MAKITILGAGITGLATASILPRDYDITIVARDLPGDSESLGWASPWAGAIWMPLYNSDIREQQIQRDALSYLSRLASKFPESSVKQIPMDEILDYEPHPKPWFHGKLPDFRVTDKHELPDGAEYGMSYRTVVLDPHTLLLFLRSRLEARGVKFTRMTVRSLSALKPFGHDVLVNASGLGTIELSDWKVDTALRPVWSQLVLVKTDHDRIYMRHGRDYTVGYTYVLPRLDGTAVLGGIRETDPKKFHYSQDVKESILKRVHQNLPRRFPANAEEFTVVKDIVGLQPQRDVNLSFSKEIVDGQKVVHACGIHGGGYIVSFGLAMEITKLVNEFVFESETSAGV